ncbi:MAG TPA: hypothetical protein VK439_12190 [Rubrivivax sp.]|nr:hypothetical protein [Rubrivivax sp.]
MTAPEQMEDTVAAVAPQADLDLTLMQRAARQTLDQLQAAIDNGRG